MKMFHVRNASFTFEDGKEILSFEYFIWDRDYEQYIPVLKEILSIIRSDDSNSYECNIGNDSDINLKVTINMETLMLLKMSGTIDFSELPKLYSTAE